ncbi:GAF domain-containing protein [Chitinispirillales bacterium ANBcel5]|uniref:GAF domain-containing protein n=1 Tax=Cellulosispirillum alkaliphilum TaxID=3039283 RepID=UPI002A500895|nr:GAF domain-containing protein [Chitinispirillales bacterium ANBcel5]
MKENSSASSRFLEGIAEISRAIMDQNYIDDLLNLIVSVTANITSSKVCSILLLDRKKNELILRAYQSKWGKYNQRSNTALGEGIAGRVAQSNTPIKVLDVRKDPRFINKAIAVEDGLVSLLSVPMSVEGEVVGVINCYTSKMYDFSVEEINMLTTVATQASVVIKNTELRVMKEVVERELEQRKIIERAKEILMDKKKISGKEAFEKMRSQSMNSRISMVKIAESIILASSFD